MSPDPAYYWANGRWQLTADLGWPNDPDRCRRCRKRAAVGGAGLLCSACDPGADWPEITDADAPAALAAIIASARLTATAATTTTAPAAPADPASSTTTRPFRPCAARLGLRRPVAPAGRVAADTAAPTATAAAPAAIPTAAPAPTDQPVRCSECSDVIPGAVPWAGLANHAPDGVMCAECRTEAATAAAEQECWEQLDAADEQARMAEEDAEERTWHARQDTQWRWSA